MRCYVCDGNQWEKLPGLHSKSMLQVCKQCGSLCHELDEKKVAAMKDYYRTEYRKAPGSVNLITTTNKLQGIERFLADFLSDAADQKRRLWCWDIGAATGYVPNWLTRLGHRAFGNELTITFRRMAEHYYGLPMTEDPNAKRKWDLVTCYHVLEHLPEPDKKLEQMRAMLSESGALFVSTPYWLESLEEQSGTPTVSFDNLYHVNHINLFTRNHLQNLFRKAGLFVAKEDSAVYGQTYLLKPGRVVEIVPEDWKEVVDKVKKQKAAIEHYVSGRPKEAIEAWPLFPEAHIALIFQLYGKDPDRQADILSNLPGPMKKNRRILREMAKWHFQYGRLAEAKEVVEHLMKGRPDAELLALAGQIASFTGQHKQAMQAFQAAANLNPTVWAQMMDMVLAEACKMPTWDERARAEMERALLGKARKEGALPEPTLEIEDAEEGGVREAQLAGAEGGVPGRQHGDAPVPDGQGHQPDRGLAAQDEGLDGRAAVDAPGGAPGGPVGHQGPAEGHVPPGAGHAQGADEAGAQAVGVRDGQVARCGEAR